MEIVSELVREGIFLSLDVVILGFIYKSYESCAAYIQALKEAEQVEISELSQLAAPKSQPRSWLQFWTKNKSAPTTSGTQNDFRYVCLRGIVEPLDKSKLLKSTDNKSTGVIQKIITKEVAKVRNWTRLWVHEERIVKNFQHEVPWGLKSQEISNPPVFLLNVKIANATKQTVVQVIEGLTADRLDIAVVRNEFTPAAFSPSGWLGGWVSGVQLKGINEVEEMVIDGSLMTAVGELVVSSDGTMQLRSPSNSDQALPFILSTLPYSALLSTYETRISVCKWSLFFFGGVGIVLCYLMIRKIHDGRRHAREEDDILRDLCESRRSTGENDDLPEEQRCVICLVRNREVIVLPCGHFCLCADCMVGIRRENILQRNCPMCRQRIKQIKRAFVP
ncbi:mitochondrial E3 ubiquitin protein ligase 1-like [Daphnia carinata]|uniref:mitochondrial E3 ubiquitin protein ligase 1-like n=1 Tax=Daphnia carinata TaxID=120202 RepID=UPI00257DFB8F|nr:mitochondrial E3 ubiquitin protein ligase 1-like [Daphnia carinata]